MKSQRKTAIVVGAGPAGLCAAEELLRLGSSVLVFEQDPTYVGGLARTVNYKGYRFDIGAHRFFSKNSEIRNWWAERLGKDLLEITRLTRILYRGKYFYYPLRLSNVLRQLGLIESARCFFSYCGAILNPIRPELSFKDWVRNRFGNRLYRIFFKSYTEKVWGMSCNSISSDWAAQRIRGLSLYRAVVESLGLRPKGKIIKTLVDKFHYPRLGSGMMWESTCATLARAGVQFRMGQRVARVLRKGDCIIAVETINQTGEVSTTTADNYIFSMPLGELALAIEPPLPETARQAAKQLKYRHLLVVLLIVDGPNPFPDHWIYVHDPNVSVGRVANPRNWNIDLLADVEKTSLVLDYFCSEGDNLWALTDEELLTLARSELETIGLATVGSVKDGHVVRVPQAYPVFDAEYKTRVAIISEALRGISNLQVAGRNGMHKYNNQDHSMLTGIMAARAANGEAVDPWKVNIDAVYIEEEIEEESSDTSRLLPTHCSSGIRS